jgi:hypothetical protein
MRLDLGWRGQPKIEEGMSGNCGEAADRTGSRDLGWRHRDLDTLKIRAQIEGLAT